MVSQEEFDQLRNSYAMLARKVADMELSMSNHVGLDYGQTGMNYPHPNQSVYTAEFGGGIMRLDPYGMQILAPGFGEGNPQPAIVFVNEDHGFHNPVPDGAPYAEVSGGVDNDSGTDRSGIHLEAFDTHGTATVDVGTNAIILQAFNEATSAYGYSLLKSDPNTGSFPQVGSTGNGFEAYLWLAGRDSDPASFQGDGSLWYRSDTDKLKLRANGATENVATESYVDANAGGSMLKTANNGYYLIPAGPGVGTSVTAGSGSMGSWAELEDSTTEAIFITHVILEDVDAANTYWQIEMGTGAAASETTVGMMKFGQIGTSQSVAPAALPFPIPVATATRIAARAASSGATACRLSLVVVAQADLADI